MVGAGVIGVNGVVEILRAPEVGFARVERRRADLRVVGGESSGDGRGSSGFDPRMEENMSCCGEADVTVALVLLKNS